MSTLMRMRGGGSSLQNNGSSSFDGTGTEDNIWNQSSGNQSASTGGGSTGQFGYLSNYDPSQPPQKQYVPYDNSQSAQFRLDSDRGGPVGTGYRQTPTSVAGDNWQAGGIGSNELYSSGQAGNSQEGIPSSSISPQARLLPNYDPAGGASIQTLPDSSPGQGQEFAQYADIKRADRTGRGLGNLSDSSTNVKFTSPHPKKEPPQYYPTKGVALNVNAQGPFSRYVNNGHTIRIYPDQSTVIMNSQGQPIGGMPWGANGLVRPTDDGGRGGEYVQYIDSAGYMTKAYADGSTEVYNPQHMRIGSAVAPRSIQEPWGYPQTITVRPGGAVLATNQSFDIDNDGTNPNLTSTQNNQQAVASGEPINPASVPYLVRSTTWPDNHGIGKHDFGVVLRNGRTVGAPYVDTGWSIGGEGSIALAREMGMNPRFPYSNGLDAGDAQTLSFPNTSDYYHSGMTADEINRVSEKIYNDYAAQHPDIIKSLGWPSRYNGPVPTPPNAKSGRRKLRPK